ncbi:TMAO reductase system periplasmic protein TorT [Aliiroseovarius crassostreae]|uniref:TMAO reductase system periplasmic protein TorT n=1 Tax=Aliiroseovarius crassostreae TaxID=154981 RepID=UPI003C7D602B
MAPAYAALRRAAIALVALLALGPPSGTALADNQTSGVSNRSICVVVPHFKDEYWLSVGYGLIKEAAKTETRLIMFESGGYHALTRQISLLQTCVERKADAILLGAVSADDPVLLAAVGRTARHVPVVGLVNELHATQLSGAVGVDWSDMGAEIGRYLTRLHPKGSDPVNAALVTGPAQSGWSPLLEAGLENALQGSSVTIRHIGRSDTGLREQLTQVEDTLRDVPDLDILIGSAPAIEGAMGLAANSDRPAPQFVSTYISHSVRRGLQGGSVVAAAFDDPVVQGRMGVQMALKAQRGVFSTEVRGPDIVLLEAARITEQRVELSPAALELKIE